MRSGRQHFINVLEVYSTNGEPRNRDIDRRPAHIIESDWSGGGLGARGEDGTDGDVVRTSRDGALRLLRGMCAETKLDFSRATGDLVGAVVGWNMPVERVKQYDEGIRKGGILMGVRPKNDEDAKYFEESWKTNRAQDVYR